MTGPMFKAYARVVLGGLVILAAIVLVLLQWSTTSDITLYGKWVTVGTWLLMLASAVGGILLLWVVKQFFHGVGTLRRQRREERRTLEAARQVARDEARRQQAQGGQEPGSQKQAPPSTPGAGT